MIPPPRTMDRHLDMRKAGPGTTLRRATITLVAAVAAAPGADIIAIIIGASDGEDMTLRTMIPMSAGDDAIVATATAMTIIIVVDDDATPALPMMTIRPRERVGSPYADGATIVAAAMIVMTTIA